MSKLMAFSAPIVPGKTEQWKKFISDLKTTHNKDFTDSRKNLNVRERTYLQQTPMGDVVVVTLEGDDPAAAFANSNNTFSEWFVKEVNEIHGFNLKDMAKMQMPELLIDSNG